MQLVNQTYFQSYLRYIQQIFYVHDNIKIICNRARLKWRLMLIHFCIFLCKSVSNQGLIVKKWKEKDGFNLKKIAIKHFLKTFYVKIFV